MYNNRLDDHGYIEKLMHQNYKKSLKSNMMEFCRMKKKHDADELEDWFFYYTVRVMRPSFAEVLSLIEEGHCIGGRFPVELPLY
jgi:hypothetical protein